jgi:hypothetical protein
VVVCVFFLIFPQKTGDGTSGPKNENAIILRTAWAEKALGARPTETSARRFRN